MPELKRIPSRSIPAALEKALRYRLLNEPREAVSICRDVLLIDEKNQSAVVTLLLALTDQLETEFTNALEEAKCVLGQIEGDYERAYYEGIINERWAKAQLARALPGDAAHGWLLAAMRCYEKAERLSPPDDPDALLRWNACARLLESVDVGHAGPRSSTHDVQAEFGDDVPPR